MVKLLKWILSLISLVIVFFVGCFCYIWLTEWRPKSVEVVYTASKNEKVTIPDTIKIVSWNIGYAGLGDDMDFFYDGGTQNRTSKERTLKNLNGIINFLKFHNDADFILLQEVDKSSHRTYMVEILDSISSALSGYGVYFAYNYNAPFVPIPITDPIGKVEAGVATFSKHNVNAAYRYAYPSEFAFPVRLFNLKRCMLGIELLTTTNDTLFINNLHNTAYDNSGMRELEIEFVSNFIKSKPCSITAGDWNSTPDGYISTKEELENEFFAPIALSKSNFDSTFSFASDIKGKTARYLYEPYKKGSTTETNIDFAVLGSAFKTLSFEIVDLGYAYSDHNPVIITLTRQN